MQTVHARICADFNVGTRCEHLEAIAKKRTTLQLVPEVDMQTGELCESFMTSRQPRIVPVQETYDEQKTSIRFGKRIEMETSSTRYSNSTGTGTRDWKMSQNLRNVLSYMRQLSQPILFCLRLSNMWYR